MKTSKTLKNSVQVDKVEVEIDVDKLASAIGRAVAEELKPILTNSTQYRPNANQSSAHTSEVEIDDSIVDVGISTAGLEKSTSDPIAKETKSEDNVSKSRNKLKNLKKK